MEENKKRPALGATKSLVYTALLAAFICIVSPFSINIGAVPLSLGLFAVYIASSILDKWRGTASVVVFILLGAFGVPVFTNFSGGFDKLVGPTGGYIFGYMPCAFIIGALIDAAENKVWVYPVAMALGTLSLYACGTAWFMFQAGVDLPAALAACVLPFIIGDALKIAAATALCFPLRRRLNTALRR